MANEKLTPIGPLPKVSRTHELQQLSLEALRAALPSDRFIIRDERIEDYGVDCSLEAKIAPPRGSQVAQPDCRGERTEDHGVGHESPRPSPGQGDRIS
jgi:hypothetical protein